VGAEDADIAAIRPDLAARGLRLLDGLPAIRLESIRSTTSPTGYLLVDYSRIWSSGTANTVLHRSQRSET
jgi:hypothetical protein